MNFPDILFYLLLFGNLVFLIIALVNLVTYPVLSGVYAPIKNTEPSGEEIIRLSVIIPARNEEKNIGNVLDSLLEQRCPENCRIAEIIVVDDGSEDKTRDIAQSFRDKFLKKETVQKFQILSAGNLPSGWLGKNHALFQGQKAATGEYLLFLDADVILAADTLEKALHVLRMEKGDMLSLFPRQITQSWGERIIVPVMNWFLLSFLVLKSVYQTKINIFIAANGQFILISRKAYDNAGSHERLKTETVEDMTLAKIIKNSGGKVITLMGKQNASARMYDSLESSLNGFAKNFFSGLGFTPFWFILFLLWAFSIFILPFFLGFFEPRFFILSGMMLFSRLMQIPLTGDGLYTMILFPLQIWAFFYLGIYSLIKTRRRVLQWKNRKIN